MFIFVVNILWLIMGNVFSRFVRIKFWLSHLVFLLFKKDLLIFSFLLRENSRYVGEGTVACDEYSIKFTCPVLIIVMPRTSFLFDMSKFGSAPLFTIAKL